jgi:hypothetical protein
MRMSPNTTALGLLALASFVSCKKEEVAPIEKSWKKLDIEFNAGVKDAIVTDDYQFLVAYGNAFYKLDKNNSLTFERKIERGYVYANDGYAPKIFRDHYFFPQYYNAVSPSLNFNSAERLSSRDLSTTFSSLRETDSTFVYNLLLPDANLLKNIGRKALILWSSKSQYSSNAVSLSLNYYDFENFGEANQKIVFNEKIILSTQLQQTRMISFRDKYFLTGYSTTGKKKVTNLLYLDGKFNKVLDEEPDSFFEVGDTVFCTIRGYPNYLMYSTNGENWNRGRDIKYESLAKVFVIEGRIIDYGGAGYLNYFPSVYNYMTGESKKIDVTGIELDKNRQGWFPSIYQITNFNGSIFFFTSTGIYSKPLKYFFD